MGEGEVGAGDALELVGRDEHNVTVADLYGIFSGDETSIDMLRRALRIKALPEGWRSSLRELLEEGGEGASEGVES